jgi:hypothetical protein
MTDKNIDLDKLQALARELESMGEWEFDAAETPFRVAGGEVVGGDSLPYGDVYTKREWETMDGTECLTIAQEVGAQFGRYIAAFNPPTMLALIALARRSQPSAEPAPAASLIDTWKHVANEWADTAYNGLQWLRNLDEGVTADVKRGIENMESCCKAAQEVWAAAHRATAAAPAATAVAAEAVRLAKEALEAVQRSHGIMLTSYPPRDAWLENRVDEKVRNALTALAAQPAPAPLNGQHPDDAAVDRFSALMKEKLAKSRAKGRGGWDDSAQCTVEFLAQLLVEHVEKGDPVDIANLAMMVQLRGGCAIDVYEALAVFMDSRQFGKGAAPLNSVSEQDAMRERVRDAIAEALGDAYDCGRVWSAWSYGTMGPDDFSLVAEDDDRLEELASAAIAAMTATPSKQDEQQGGPA